MDLDKLRELIEIFEQSDLNEIEIEEEGRRILLRKGKEVHTYAPMQLPAQPMHPMTVGQPASQPQAQAPSADDVVEDDPSVRTINSPLVGTFYSGPAPGEPPFVEVGDRVEEGQTTCIVEAMKVMNEVSAKISGVIERILVENGEPVEFGQPLFAVRVS